MRDYDRRQDVKKSRKKIIKETNNTPNLNEIGSKGLKIVTRNKLTGAQKEVTTTNSLIFEFDPSHLKLGLREGSAILDISPSGGSSGTPQLQEAKLDQMELLEQLVLPV